MLKSFDEMTPDQQLAYKMGYEAARSELRVAGRDDLRRGDSIPDALVDEAAKRVRESQAAWLRETNDDWLIDSGALARVALGVLFPGEEEE